MKRNLMGIAVVVWLSGIGSVTRAADVGAAPAPSVRIWNGTASPTCAWPATVMLSFVDNGDQAICSGSLIAPNIVAYAAHCGANIDQIFFGENILTSSWGIDRPVRTLNIARGSCKTYPGHAPENGTDFAYCKLPAPVLDVPVVPILMGCETAALKAGQSVTFVGFGLDEANLSGIKHQVKGTIDSRESNKVSFAASGTGICFGDSGGPAYTQVTSQDPVTGLADNTWRVFGITSYLAGSTCGDDASYDSLLSLAVPWIEADSGVDVTPCTDAYGTWQPGPNCGHFPLAPGASGNIWANGCANDQVAASLSATCGPPYNAKAPQVTVTGPNSGATLLGATVNVTLNAQAGDGTALASVMATFDGVEIAALSAAAPNYAFGPLTLTTGDHTLVVVAKDKVGISTTVNQKFVVNGSLALDAQSQSTDAGGGCNAAPNAAMWVGVLGLWMVRRYGRRHSPQVLGILALCALTACAGNIDMGEAAASVAAGGAVNLQVATTSQETTGVPKAQNPSTERLTSLPAQAATFTGSVVGHTLKPQSAYFYFLGGSTTYMVLHLGDEANGCALAQADISTKSASSLTMIFGTNAAGEDTPTDGTYTVLSLEALQSDTTHSRVAAADFIANSATCTSLISSAATAGEISITTHITNSGSYLEGTYKNVVMGSDTISGSFTAYSCDLTNAANTSTCR